MKTQLHRAILVSACLLACPGLMISQEPPAGAPNAKQSDAESLVKELVSQEQALVQARRELAVTYREMAKPSESDSEAAHEMKSRYQRLAECEEKAAAATEKMATYHAQLALLLPSSQNAAPHRSVLGGCGLSEMRHGACG